MGPTRNGGQVALSQQTINKHNVKRAEIFAANGLCDLDIAFAHPEFTGYANSDVDCTLCEHKHIKWLFAIRFDAPDILTALGKVSTGIVRTEAVTLLPVGSKCITDWLDAIPESLEKLAALKIWHKEMAKANKAKAKKALETKLIKLGYGDLAGLSAALYAVLADAKTAKVNLKWFLINKIRTYAKKAKWGTIKSTSPVNTAHDYLVEARAKIDAKLATVTDTVETPVVETPVAPKDELAHLTDDARKAVLKGREVYKTGKDALSKDHLSAFVDIGKKLVKYGSFVSSAQRGFYQFLVGKLEDGADKVAAPVVTTATPGDDNFVSASDLVGARY